MSEVELALIERWMRTHEVKIVGDVREMKDIHISYERIGSK